MTDHTAAARQRRSRAHRRGDHTICLPERCKHAAAADVGEAAKDSAPPPTPAPSEDFTAVEQLGPRGRRLWADMSGLQLGPAHRVLLQEACRTADRLDRLDRMLDNRDDWIQARVLDLGEAKHVRVTVDGLLSEARQQALALRSIVGELRQALGAINAHAAPGAPPPSSSSSTSSSDTPRKGLGSIGDLTARIAAARGGQGAG